MKSKDDEAERIAIFLLTGSVIFAVISYLTVAFLCFTASLQLPAVLPTLGGVVRMPGHWHHLSHAFPPQVRKLLPSNGWIPLVLLTLLAIAGAAASWLHVDRLKGRRRMALRSYDPRAKVTPRAWARPRDVRHLRKKVADSWTMLRLDRRRIGTAPETHVLLVAPAGSGKTTGPVTTWTVEHDGPAVVTSTKGDIVNLTAGARLAQGPVWIYAPGVDPRALPLPACGWTPLAGCEDWEFAQLMAGWLAADAIGGNNVQESDGARFYNHEASKLLAPLLHAARLGGVGMAAVVGWVRSQDDGPLEILSEHRATAAHQRLEAFRHGDERRRSLTVASAAQLIDAYDYPSVAATDYEDFDAERLLDGGTLYLVAPEARQNVVAPLFAAVLGSVLRAAETRASTQRAPLSPELRLVLDETANLAAIDNLPTVLATCRGWGVRVATVWQNIGQITQRYGHDADTILGNSLAKLALGPIQDRGTADYLINLLDSSTGHQVSYDMDALGGRRARSAVEREEQKATAQTLQQLGVGEGIYIHGRDLPIKGRVLPHWKNRKVREQLAQGELALHTRQEEIIDRVARQMGAGASISTPLAGVARR